LNFVYLSTKDNMTIVWDETFVDTDGKMKWCSRPKVVVPVPLDTAGFDISQHPFILVSNTSSNPNPHLKVVSIQFESREALCQIPDQFFEQNNC